ncbi:hypothetical protein E4U60_004333 [Claviceps pazoutovae]|uniref:Uncharacterized protein n=1 Tax=Claviceps pazoutovae TaxID=1649127 RepID=A0A9P7SEZ5_9HYPO|nr:hypothetical protein E4U60_004333 [Claviceps pazoutovae]
MYDDADADCHDQGLAHSLHDPFLADIPPDRSLHEAIERQEEEKAELAKALGGRKFMLKRNGRDNWIPNGPSGIINLSVIAAVLYPGKASVYLGMRIISVQMTEPHMIQRETRARATTGSRCRDAADATSICLLFRVASGWRARLERLRLNEAPCCRDKVEQRTLTPRGALHPGNLAWLDRLVLGAKTRRGAGVRYID